MAKRDSFLLRLNPELMEAVRRWSEDEFRSMNAQIEMVLVDALRRAGRLKGPSPSQPECLDSDDGPPPMNRRRKPKASDLDT